MPGALHTFIQTLGRLESAISGIQETMRQFREDDRARWKDIEIVVEALSSANRVLTEQVREIKAQIKWALRIGRAVWAVVGATIAWLATNYDQLAKLFVH